MEMYQPFSPHLPAAPGTKRDKLSAWDVVYSLNMGIALLHLRDDIVTTGITTAVVMVVAAMSPNEAWQQPLLRLFDTLVGIALGVLCKWIGSYLFFGRTAT
jgi:hypothetical protein